MYADKRITSGAIHRTTKLFRIKESIVGVCGEIEQGIRFIEWLKYPSERPIFAEANSFSALELTPKGKILWWGTALVPMPVEEEFYGIGSGAAYALGAMCMGASPKKAILIASRWDESTGDEIQAMTLRSKS
jgi:hypothetical protein